jgi:hypothetical protein
MTILSLNPSVSAELRTGKMFTEVSSTVQKRPLPCISLRKRSACTTKMSLESVNSAFLSGLFADVANASISTTIPEGEEEDAQPIKKTRISKTKSLSRCGRSFKILNEALTSAVTNQVPTSPAQANTDFFACEAVSFHSSCSLHDQLNLVALSSGADVTSAANLVFPNLPATVSNPYCSAATTTAATATHSTISSSPSKSTLIRVISDLQSSVNGEPSCDAEKQESYGWFVQLEDDVVVAPAPEVMPDPYAGPQDLAFSAYTAPKADNYDAEVEWAKAADTVDDVLGDFF